MKRIKFFAVAAMLLLTSGAYAQFSNSASSSSSVSSNSEGWSTIWVEYNPISIKFNKGVDDESATGLSFGYSQAFPVSSGTPIFIEAGIGVQYAFKSDFWDQDDVNFSMVSAKVPVNFIYDFAIPNSSVRLDPFVGLTLRYNITAKFSNEDDDVNLFDKDDMGSNKNTMKRFQPGWQIGLKARFGSSFMAGVSYGSDFSTIWEPNVGEKVKANVSTTTLTVGYVF